MKEEFSPVTLDELVVRLIWKDFYKPGRDAPILERAFLPRADETEGISVFRTACLASPVDALTAFTVEKRNKYVIVLIPVVELTDLGLSVLPMKIDAVPGHAVIPELNTTLLASDRTKCLELQKRLAMIAARRLILPTEGLQN